MRSTSFRYRAHVSMPTSDATAEDNPKIAGTAAFGKFMAVLQLIADQETPLSIAQLSAQSGYPRPTVYRILAALTAEGMVVENPRTRHFELGPRLINLAGKFWARSDIRATAIDALQQLRDLTRETVHLAVPSDNGMVYIEKLESPQAVRMASRVGTRVTLYSSSVGKAYLAALDDTTRNRLLRTVRMHKLTERTITDPEVLRVELALAQQRGYTEDNEENEAQIFCVGAPIFGAEGAPVACISISIPLFRKPADLRKSLADPLLATCRLITQRLSGPAR